MSKETPCHYCKNRNHGCHDICPDYIKWCQENNERRAIIMKSRYEDSLIPNHTNK